MNSRKSVVWVFLVVLASAGPGLGSLSDGLMAYYPFNGNTNDATGHYDPLAVDGVIPTNDRFGNANGAYVLDGVDDQIYGFSYDPVVPSAQGSFAVSFWLKPTTTWTLTENPNSLLVGNHHGCWPAEGWFDWGIMVWPPDGSPDAGKFYFWWIGALPGSGTSVWVALKTTTTTWIGGAWYNLIVNYSLSTNNLSIWVNGICENQVTVSDNIGQNLAGDTLTIGRYDFRHADMAIDDLRLYNRPVSADEIAELADVKIDATANMDPEVLNLNSKGKWVTCYVDLPAGHTASDIDVDSVLLEGLLDVQQSDIQDGVLMVKFDREDLAAYLEVVLGVVPPVEVELVVTGNLTDGTPFEGKDTIRVVDQGGGK